MRGLATLTGVPKVKHMKRYTCFGLLAAHSTKENEALLLAVFHHAASIAPSAPEFIIIISSSPTLDSFSALHIHDEPLAPLVSKMNHEMASVTTTSSIVIYSSCIQSVVPSSPQFRKVRNKAWDLWRNDHLTIGITKYGQTTKGEEGSRILVHERYASTSCQQGI